MGCGCQKGARGAAATLHRVEWPLEGPGEQERLRIRRYVSKAEAVAAMALRPGGTYYPPTTS